MKIHTNQSGFSIVEVLIVVAVVAVLSFVGYTVYDRQQVKTTDSESNTTQQITDQSSSATDVKSAPTINSTEDLDKAEAILDQTDPGGSNNVDANQLDSETSAF